MSKTETTEGLFEAGPMSVKAAVKAERVVLIVQSKADAEAFAVQGATVAAPIDGVWKPVYAKAFSGATVLILPAASLAGRDFAADVHVSLYKTAKESVIVEIPGLPHEGTPGEWIGSPDGSVERLLAIGKRLQQADPEKQMVRAVSGTPIFPKSIQNLLPRPLRNLVGVYNSDRALDVVTIGGLGVLSGSLPNVEGQYGNDVYGPNIYVFVLAPAASEKGVLTHARQLGQAIDTWFRSSYPEELAQWALDKKNNEHGAGPKPRRAVLFISGDVSASALVRQLHTNKGGGIMLETEADTLSQTLQKDYGSYSDVLRKAHAHESVSINRVEEEISIARPFLSIVIAGTPNQLPRLIPSAEDGLFSRFLFYAFVQDNPLLWMDPRPRAGNNTADLLESGMYDVKNVFLKLNSRSRPLRFFLTESQWDVLSQNGEAIKRKLVSAFEYTGASVAHRAAVHVFRIAMIIGLWEAVEQGQDLKKLQKFGVSDQGLMAAIKIVKVSVVHTVKIMSALPKEESGDSPAFVKWFLALPIEFKTSHAIELAGKVGFSKRAANSQIAEMLTRGRLEKLSVGRYRKV